MSVTRQPKRGVSRNLLLLLALVFCLIGIAVAYQQGFEKRAGRALEKAAPVARRVIPRPAKVVLREIRDWLPVYGPAGQWLARKGASIVYFGVVGAFVLAIRRRKPQTLLGTLAVTTIAAIAMSAFIEVLEWPEEIDDELFDLFCGAVGGLLAGAAAWWWWRRRRAIGST